MKYCYQGGVDFDFYIVFFVWQEKEYMVVDLLNVYCFLVECQKEFDWVYYLDIG